MDKRPSPLQNRTPEIAASTSRLPLAWTIKEFARETGLSRDNIYEAIRAKQLIARKFGRRTLIYRNDGEAFLGSLPKLQLDGPRLRFGRPPKAASGDVNGDRAAPVA
jgi:excisionase family DNA binding protein